MSNPIWIEKPDVLVRVDASLVVALFDAAAVDRGTLSARLRTTHEVKNAPETITLLFQMHTDVEGVDLSALALEGADADGVWSMVDLIDNYMEIHSVTSARREGDEVHLEVFVDRMMEGQGAYTLGPDENHSGRASCGLEALRAALARAQPLIQEVVDVHACVVGADEDTSQESWRTWAASEHGYVRHAVIKNGHAHDDALVALAERGGHMWQLVRRRRLPARVLELIYETRTRELPEYAVTHADAPDALLERAIHDARHAKRHHTATKVAARAHASLAERKLAAGADLDQAFGDLRSLLEATPSEDTAAAVFKALQAAHAREPGRVAERWVPYAREHMRDWERHDCTLPLELVTRWVRHREISPVWAIARVLAFQRHVAGAPDSAWTAFADSPHLGAVESLGVRHQVGAHALASIARASLPSLTHLVMIHWGQATSSPDASVLATAAWAPQLEHIMLGSYTLPPDALARLLARAPRLRWLSLFEVDFDASHVAALVASGAHETIEYLSLNDSDTAEGLEALGLVNTPKLKSIQLHNTELTEGQLEVLRDSQPSGVKISNS